MTHTNLIELKLKKDSKNQAMVDIFSDYHRLPSNYARFWDFPAKPENKNPYKGLVFVKSNDCLSSRQ